MATGGNRRVHKTKRKRRTAHNDTELMRRCLDVEQIKIADQTLALLFSSQYLDVSRTLEGYGTVVFPHCACDARRSGHVIASVSLSNFRLQACSTEGDKEVSVLYRTCLYT